MTGALALLVFLGLAASPEGSGTATLTPSAADAGRQGQPLRKPFRPDGPRPVVAPVAVSKDAGVAPARSTLSKTPPSTDARSRRSPRRPKRRRRPEPAPPPTVLPEEVPEAPKETSPPPIERVRPSRSEKTKAPASSLPPALVEMSKTVSDMMRALTNFVTTLFPLVLGVFLLLRLLDWFIRRRARHGGALFGGLARAWRFLEALVWLLVLLWVAVRMDTFAVAYLTVGALALGAALSGFNLLRDGLAGILLALERPFAVADYVRIGEAEGRVVAFRTRVVELETREGDRIRVPYRSVLGARDVLRRRQAGTHPVNLRLRVPEHVEPGDGLKTATELAASSPWAVLGPSPRLQVDLDEEGPTIDVEAYAFDAEARVLLHADLLKGWRSWVKSTRP